MPDPLVQRLADGVRRGSRADLARAITLSESRRPDHRRCAAELLSQLRPDTGGAVRLGISGVPGVGKSTFIDTLGSMLIRRGHRVAVLAVDPSSSRTGGSILGDRTRMGALAGHEQAFVRPSPSGGHLGGVARATREAMLLTEAAGYDVVIVETVGVGQSEVAVADMVDTFLLLSLARTGDQLQGIKRGILELADVVAMNKADEGEQLRVARQAARELTGALRLMRSGDDGPPPVVLTCSGLSGAGLDEVWEAILTHRERLDTDGLQARRALQQRNWMWTLAETELVQGLHRSGAVRDVREQIEADVETGRLSAVDGATKLIQAYRTHGEQY